MLKKWENSSIQNLVLSDINLRYGPMSDNAVYTVPQLSEMAEWDIPETKFTIGNAYKAKTHRSMIKTVNS